ncbi:MAG: cation:proton antiporter subunit C [Spirochaetales bacterium]|nr:cation:proton antiporter subunit C [Spirochaetales bacterium]
MMDYFNSEAALTHLMMAGILSLVVIGLYGILTRKNLIKIFLSLGVVETAVNILIVALPYRKGGVAPILTGQGMEGFLDPVPQALVLTSIVIGLAITALGLVMAVKFYQHEGHLNIRKMNGLKR